MKRWQERKAWKTVTFAALAVVAFASPAAAAELSTTTLQASPSPATTGQLVNLSTTVTCAEDPSGGLGMTFFDGPTILATIPVDAHGKSAYTASFTSTGTHTITAAYNGNDDCYASNSTTTIEVSATRCRRSMSICTAVGCPAARWMASTRIASAVGTARPTGGSSAARTISRSCCMAPPRTRQPSRTK